MPTATRTELTEALAHASTARRRDWDWIDALLDQLLTVDA